MGYRGFRLNENAGSFRSIVNVYSITETSDGLGAGGDREETLFAQGIRCRIEDASAKERETSKKNLTGDNLEMSVTHRVVMWYLAGIKANMVVVDQVTSARYEIVEILNPDQRNEKYILRCIQYGAYE